MVIWLLEMIRKVIGKYFMDQGRLSVEMMRGGLKMRMLAWWLYAAYFLC